MIISSSVKTIIKSFCLFVFLTAACVKPAPVMDRADPEAVLRAYFDAWKNGDWSTQASLMDAKYGHMANEPLAALHIVQLQLFSSPSSTVRTYLVIFEIVVKGKGVSMQNGRYVWTYELTYDGKKGSWIITNYGAG